MYDLPSPISRTEKRCRNPFAKERAELIASEWSEAMKSGSVKDFVAVGDVDIKVIGADNQIPDSEIPVREMLEQIVAKLGIPPFLLGLSWSTTETMSKVETDVLTTELWHYRRHLTRSSVYSGKSWNSLVSFAAIFLSSAWASQITLMNGLAASRPPATTSSSGLVWPSS